MTRPAHFHPLRPAIRGKLSGAPAFASPERLKSLRAKAGFG
jgi:hypothetical protein